MLTPWWTEETIDTIKPEDWRRMTPEERTAFYRYWGARGHISHDECSVCDYPRGLFPFSSAWCEACGHPEARLVFN